MLHVFLACLVVFTLFNSPLVELMKQHFISIEEFLVYRSGVFQLVCFAIPTQSFNVASEEYFFVSIEDLLVYHTDQSFISVVLDTIVINRLTDQMGRKVMLDVEGHLCQRERNSFHEIITFLFYKKMIHLTLYQGKPSLSILLGDSMNHQWQKDKFGSIWLRLLVKCKGQGLLVFGHI